MININKIELAWAAGFFDGEGCIAIKQGRTNRNLRRYLSLVIRISQNESSCFCLKRFKSAIGNLGSIVGPYRKGDYALELNKFEDTQATIAMLWPFLSKPKKEQYKRKLAELRSRVE